MEPPWIKAGANVEAEMTSDFNRNVPMSVLLYAITMVVWFGRDAVRMREILEILVWEGASTEDVGAWRNSDRNVMIADHEIWDYVLELGREVSTFKACKPVLL